MHLADTRALDALAIVRAAQRHEHLPPLQALEREAHELGRARGDHTQMLRRFQAASRYQKSYVFSKDCGCLAISVSAIYLRAANESQAADFRGQARDLVRHRR